MTLRSKSDKCPEIRLWTRLDARFAVPQQIVDENRGRGFIDPGSMQ